MKNWEKRLFLNDMRKAIDYYDLIPSGSKILVAVSGGKDSMLLFYGLNLLKRYGIYDFKIHGILIDNGYIENPNLLKDYYEKIGYSFEIYNENDKLDFNEKNVTCHTCARIRKGTLSRLAIEREFDAIATGHTKDDIVETFLMNLIEGGKIKGLDIKSKFEMEKLSIIRPLAYVDEKNIIKASEIIKYPILKSLCPLSEKTLRSTYDDTLKYLDKKHPEFKDRVLKALK